MPHKNLLLSILLSTAFYCFWQGLGPTFIEEVPYVPVTQASLEPYQTKKVVIQDIKVGQRMVGTNPLREQVESWEPNSETWKELRFHMHKQSGSSLWVTLIRPNWWVESKGAYEGGTVQLDLPEMGALGDAEVTYLGPCPEISPGEDQPVVTGTFKHEVDGNSNVIHLRLLDQSEPTGVTDNHPYWSVDRGAFVPAGELLVGEKVNTVDGTTHVASVKKIDYSGFLYNLETTEHVYRVGSLGTLVHNACEDAFVPSSELEDSARRLRAASTPDPSVLQTGGHTLSNRTVKGLGLSKDQAKRAIEGLKRDIGRGNDFHQTRILDNGDVIHSDTGDFLGNLNDYL